MPRKSSAIVLTIALLACPYLCAAGGVASGVPSNQRDFQAESALVCCGNCAAQSEAPEREPFRGPADSCGFDCLCDGAVLGSVVNFEGLCDAAMASAPAPAVVSLPPESVTSRLCSLDTGPPGRAGRELRALLSSWVC